MRRRRPAAVGGPPILDDEQQAAELDALRRTLAAHDTLHRTAVALITAGGAAVFAWFAFTPLAPPAVWWRQADIGDTAASKASVLDGITAGVLGWLALSVARGRGAARPPRPVVAAALTTTAAWTTLLASTAAPIHWYWASLGPLLAVTAAAAVAAAAAEGERGLAAVNSARYRLAGA